MPPIKTILAPTDFSKEATNALVYAINLASRISVNLIIIHVDDEVQRAIIGAAKSNAEKYDGYIKDQFDRIKHDYLYGRQVQYEFKSYKGNVGEVIRKAANTLKADLIVMGRKGKGSLYEEQMGSITVSFLNRAPCAIIAVPGTCRKLDLSNIAIASDMVTSFPDHQMYTLNYILAATKSKVNVVKIRRERELELVNNKQQDMRVKFNALLSTYIHEFHEIENNDIVYGLNQFTDHFRTDLLVLLKKNHPDKESAFGPRLSNVMTLSAKIPLMIIPIDN